MERRTSIGAEVHSAENHGNCANAAVANFSLQGAGSRSTAWQLQYTGEISARPLPFFLVRHTVHQKSLGPGTRPVRTR